MFLQQSLGCFATVSFQQGSEGDFRCRRNNTVCLREYWLALQWFTGLATEKKDTESKERGTLSLPPMLRGSIPVNSSEYFLENDATKGRTTSGSFSDWICSNTDGMSTSQTRRPEKKKRKEGYNVFEKLEHEIEVRVDAEENELSDKSQHHALLHQSRALLILLFLLWEHKDLQQGIRHR